MSGRGRKSKVQVHGAKPELPPFLQAMRQQIVANEDSERKERSLRKRKEMSKSGGSRRSAEEEDDPTVVKVDDNDLTEEEYKRMKRDLETQYKLDQDSAKDDAACGQVDLDVDKLIEQRGQSTKGLTMRQSSAQASRLTKEDGKSSDKQKDGQQRGREKNVLNSNKKLSYSSSSDDDKDEDR